MKNLEEQDIIRMMREEWDKKLASLTEAAEVALSTKIDGKEKQVIDSDLKLRHKKTKYLYTVVSVSPRDVVLKTPEGKNFLVDKAELEANYELD